MEITNHAIAAGFHPNWAALEVLGTDRPLGQVPVKKGEESETTTMAQRIRREPISGGWGTIGDRKEEGRSEKLRKIRKMKGEW